MGDIDSDMSEMYMTCVNDSNFEAPLSAAKPSMGTITLEKYNLRFFYYLALHGIIMSLGFVVTTKGEDSGSTQY